MDPKNNNFLNKENSAFSHNVNRGGFGYYYSMDNPTSGNVTQQDYAYSYQTEEPTLSNTTQPDYTYSYQTGQATTSNVIQHQQNNTQAYEGDYPTSWMVHERDYTPSHQTGQQPASNSTQQSYPYSNQKDDSNTQTAQNFTYPELSTTTATDATNQQDNNYSSSQNAPLSRSSLAVSEDHQQAESAPPPLHEVVNCVICGLKADGIHYGAMTCLSCPKFFRRSYRSYRLDKNIIKCKKIKRCTNFKGTGSCRFCRLQACLKMDMHTHYNQMRTKDFVCLVCNDELSENDHAFKNKTCVECKTFFEVCVKRQTVAQCQYDRKCITDSEARKKCSFCLLLMCICTDRKYGGKKAYLCYNLPNPDAEASKSAKEIPIVVLPAEAVQDAAEANGVLHTDSVPDEAREMGPVPSQPTADARDLMVVPPATLNFNAARSTVVSDHQTLPDAAKSSVFRHPQPVIEAAESIVVAPSDSVSGTPIAREYCEVCGGEPSGVYNKATICHTCKNIFSRYAENPGKIECKTRQKCVTDPESFKSCDSCKLNMCFVLGMHLYASGKKQASIAEPKSDGSTIPVETSKNQPQVSNEAQSLQLASSTRNDSDLREKARRTIAHLNSKWTYSQEKLHVLSAQRMVRVKIPTTDRCAAWRCFAPSMYQDLVAIDESFLETNILEISEDQNLDILQEATFHLYLLRISPGVTTRGMRLPDGRVLAFSSLCLLFGEKMADELVFIGQFARRLRISDRLMTMLLIFVFARFQKPLQPNSRQLTDMLQKEILDRVTPVEKLATFLSVFNTASKSLRKAIMPWFPEHHRNIQLPEDFSDMLNIPWEKPEVQPPTVEYVEIDEE